VCGFLGFTLVGEQKPEGYFVDTGLPSTRSTLLIKHWRSKMSGINLQSSTISSAPHSSLASGSYTIQPSDTLGDIASRYGTTVDQLMAQNPQIKDANSIFAGDVLQMEGNARGYTVQSGDTLSGIAAAHGTSLDSLLNANPQITNADMIYPGDSLNLPGATNGAGVGNSTAGSPSPSNGAAATPTPDSSAGATAKPGASGGAANALAPLDMQRAFTDTNGRLTVAIGHSEGNRTTAGGFTSSYAGHVDPGNGAANMGSFSYQVKQGGASTPEQADRVWLRQMQGELPAYQAAASKAGLDPNNPMVAAVFFDTYTQAPAAAIDAGGLRDRMGNIADAMNTQTGSDLLQSLVRERVSSYVNPATGRLEAGGFGNSPERLAVDQARRTIALARVMDPDNKLGMNNLDFQTVGRQVASGTWQTAPQATATTSAPAATGSQPGANTNSTALPQTIANGGYINKGATGEEVKDLQRLLIANGANIKVTGTFDNATAAAVEAFKADPKHPLGTAQGQPQSAVGKTTWENLVRYAQGDSGSAPATPDAQNPSRPANGDRLNVPFYKQTDNFTQPDRTCNSSANAMAAKFLGANLSGDDAYLERVLARGDTTDHGVQTAVLQSYGIRSTWHQNLDFKDLDQALANGKPVVIGILHRGSESAPTGGHMITVIGRQGNDYIVNDPYGSLNDGYRGPAENGNGAVYTREALEARWTADGPNSGWGRLFQ
jgi:LysM repeat protein